MATPPFLDYVTPSSTADGLQAEDIEGRILTCLSVIASGENPDGSTWPGGGGGVFVLLSDPTEQIIEGPIAVYAIRSLPGNNADPTEIYGNEAFGYLALASVQPAVGDGPNNYSGAYNTAIGFEALNGDIGGSLTTNAGSANTAVGWRALYLTGGAAATASNQGIQNIGVGGGALQSNIVGSNNTALGFSALALCTVSNQVAVGYYALELTTTGTGNTAVGTLAARGNTTGTNNTAVGYEALLTAGAINNNTALGYLAATLLGGAGNTAVGSEAMSVTPGNPANCVAVGFSALANVEENNNVGVGAIAGLDLTNGADNVFVGYGAGYPSSTDASTTSSGQTLVGYQTGLASASQANYITALGYEATVTATGGVAIGTDHTGAGATSLVEDQIMLGTANHTIQVAGTIAGIGAVASARPTAWTSESVPRQSINSITASILVTTDLHLTLIYLPAGTVVNNLTCITGTTPANGPTHFWMALCDNNRNLLATSADQGSAGIAASTVFTLAVANIASGASATFTTTYSGFYYHALMIVATSAVPTLTGVGGSGPANALAPILSGTSTTGLSTAPTFPTQFTTISAGGGIPYVGTS